MRRRPVRWVLIAAIVEAAATWLRRRRFGGNLIVRCRQGHLFSTIWIPAASVKSVRVGWWRFQRCPVGGHWWLVTPVRESRLTAWERRRARQRADARLP